MAKKADQKSKPTIKTVKIKPSMRDLAKNDKNAKKAARLRKSKSSRLGKLKFFGKKTDGQKKPTSKLGRLLSKLIPGFLRNAWAELRQVTWPNRRETVRLSVAVFIFAGIFAILVSALDLGLDKVFREFIIKV